MDLVARENVEPAGNNRTSMDVVSDREIVITRLFRAPARIVFDAWTRPEHVRRWWAPASRGVTVVECEVDLRPGGSYRYVLGRGEAERFAFSGEYREIVPPARLVYTQRFEPMPDEVISTVTFEERGSATLVVAHELYPSKEVRAAVLSSGMESGMRETYDQLDDLVAKLGG